MRRRLPPAIALVVAACLCAALAAWASKPPPLAQVVSKPRLAQVDDRPALVTLLRDTQALPAIGVGSAIGGFQPGYVNTTAELPPPEWLPPSTLVPPTGAPLPQVVLGARGHALATWTDWSSHRVYASYRPPGAPHWLKAVELGSKGVELAFGPGSSDAALDPLGNAVVVSSTPSSSEVHGSVFAQYRLATSSVWQRPVRLSAPGVRVHAGGVQVEMDDAGNAVAVWQRLDEKRVEASYRPRSTGVWQSPVTLWTSLAGHWELSVAADGSAVVAAMINLGPDATGQFSVHAVEAVTGSRGSWLPPERVAPGTPQRSSDLSIAAGSGGRGVIAWSDTIAGNEVVQAASHTTSEGWEQPESLSFRDGQASKPKVAIDGAGNMFAVWDATVDVEASTRSAAGAWTRPVAISAPMRSTYLSPSLSANAHGQALAAWEAASPDYGQYVVQASLFAPGVGWQQATTLSTSTREIGGPAAFGGDVDSAGDGLVYWDAWDGTSPPWAPLLAVQVAMLDAGGPLLHAASPLKLPTISGVPKVGRVLTCRPGRWSGTPPIAISYQWQRGGRVVASRVRYLVRPADLGAALRCRVTGSNVHGSATVTSAPVRVR